MRVVCEFCQTVYNIPDEKLVRDTSQATCKVCKNKILIRRTPAAGSAPVITTRSAMPADAPSNDPTMPRSPAATPTRISDAIPEAPPSMATTEPSIPAQGAPVGAVEENIPETELSNSWREAIVDNRGTIDLLRKTAVSVDDAEPTIAEPLPPPRAAAPPASIAAIPFSRPMESISLTEDGPPLEIAGAPKNPPRPIARPAAAASPASAPRSTASPAADAARGADVRGSSATIRLVGAFVCAAAAAALVHNGGWALGLSGVAAFGACAFAATALAADGILRRRDPISVLGILALAGFVAAAAAAVVLATGGARTRALAAEHAFLAPFADFTARAAAAAPVPTPVPEVTPLPEETVAEPAPSPVASPVGDDVPF